MRRGRRRGGGKGNPHGSMKEMVGGCCVCSDERGWAENPLVYCDGHGCNVAVHQGRSAAPHRARGAERGGGGGEAGAAASPAGSPGGRGSGGGEGGGFVFSPLFQITVLPPGRLRRGAARGERNRPSAAPRGWARGGAALYGALRGTGSRQPPPAASCRGARRGGGGGGHPTAGRGDGGGVGGSGTAARRGVKTLRPRRSVPRGRAWPRVTPRGRPRARQPPPPPRAGRKRPFSSPR